MREEIRKKISASPDDQVALGDMQIKDEEIAEIIELIAKTRPDIEELFLHKNQLTDEGAIALSKGLSALKKLTQLDLQFNNIGKEGLSAIYREKGNAVKLAVNGNKVVDVDELEECKKFAYRK